jgi:hypothetical protein
MPKTATTCMQVHLFSQHSQVEYLGKYDKPERSGLQFPNPATQAMKKELLESTHSRPTDRCRREMAKVISRAIANRRIPLWSREGHTRGSYEDKRRQARFFREAFGPCKVIIYVRRPDKFVESMYFQALKGFQKPDRTPWPPQLGSWPRYFDLETWLEASWNCEARGTLGHLLCADTADAYADQFGRENVRLFLFEQFVDDPESTIRGMCQFIGIDGEEGVRLMKGKRANERWTVEQIERLKAIERSPRDARIFRESRPAVRREMLGLSENNQSRSSQRATAKMSADWSKRISDFVCDDHRRLKSNWKLPLSNYGYSLQCQTRCCR